MNVWANGFLALISAGQNASFEIQLDEKPGTITWLKDNKPLDDRLADRITTTELPGNYYRLEIKHCWYVDHLRHSYADNGVNFFDFLIRSESDSGLYVAKASNGSDSSTCSAQLIVHESEFALELVY